MREAARRAGMTVSAVRAAILAGQLPADKTVSGWAIDPDVLRDFIARRRDGRDRTQR